ncbi:CvpA family protein [Kallotenue papyrolyticum]|uniref:CvpA family protein n=1 Tax=Kallotenue papyrolyticum TaxID=1325125 RepID=UPI0004924245|nr:CvpA family protein [Kallotenue papyrolyticum]
MTFALIPSIVIGVVILLGALNGWRRGGIREEAALIGVLLGALLVEFWAERWGQMVAEWFASTNVARLRWLVAMTLLFGTTVFSGYGVGLLLPRAPLKSTGRLTGALLGLITVTLALAFGLRYTQQFLYNQNTGSWILRDPLSRALVTWTDAALALAAAALALAAVVAGTLRLVRRLSRPTTPAPKPAAVPSKPAPASAAAPSPAGSSAGAGTPSGSATAPTQPVATRPPVGQQEKFIEPPRKP